MDICYDSDTYEPHAIDAIVSIAIIYCLSIDKKIIDINLVRNGVLWLIVKTRARIRQIKIQCDTPMFEAGMRGFSKEKENIPFIALQMPPG